ncbi:DUF4189 domain-containing protein [Gallaecimonas sp. GXIMD4217]|uniref:DUF4189 domain-containing protein n=1 Tax=Gallaecimonas sp. GXIMD4217 TaxID=3131927 RepID=UPI00311B2B8F
MNRYPLLLAATLSGCTATPDWVYNLNVAPDKQQQIFEADSLYCQTYASGDTNLPVPVIIPSYRTVGTYAYRNAATGQTYVGSYRSYSGPDMQLLGVGIAAYFVAKAVKYNNRYNECIARMGWQEIPCQTCVPDEANPVFKVKKDYLEAAYNKALAYSSDHVYIGAAWGVPTKAEAIKLALKTCFEQGKQECQVQSVNGVDLLDPSDASELARISEQAPPKPVPVEYRDISIKVTPADAMIGVAIHNKGIPNQEPGRFQIKGDYAEKAAVVYKVNDKRIEQWWQVVVYRDGYYQKKLRLDFNEPSPVTLDVVLDKRPEGERDIETSYQKASNHKAKAVSSTNTTGYAWGMASKKQAISEAIKYCEDGGGGDCKIVNINGENQGG